MPNVKNLCLSCMTNNLQNGKCSVCGAVETELWAAPHHLKPRTLLAGKYLVGKVLGEGGFGITYVGWDTVLSMKIAVKEYYPNGFVTREASHDSTVRSFSGEKGAYYEKGRGQFMEEAQRLARFFGLPGIVSVKDFFTENGTAYIVMEFVEGATLKKVLGNMGERMPEAHVLEIMKPLVRSLAHMHKSGVIHRDIKPDNIMLQPDGSVKLIDFGAARDADTDGKSTAAVMSHGYAPEEQYDPNRTRQGPWTDVYSFCATIFRAIEGHTPPDAITRLRKDTFAGFTVPVSENTRRVVTKGLALAPKDRWHNLDALAVELYPQTGMDFAAHSEEQVAPLKPKATPRARDNTHVVPISAPKPLKPEIREKPWFMKPRAWVSAAAVVVVVIALVIVLVSSGESREPLFHSPSLAPSEESGLPVINMPSSSPEREVSLSPSIPSPSEVLGDPSPEASQQPSPAVSSSPAPSPSVTPPPSPVSSPSVAPSPSSVPSPTPNDIDTNISAADFFIPEIAQGLTYQFSSSFDVQTTVSTDIMSFPAHGNMDIGDIHRMRFVDSNGITRHEEYLYVESNKITLLMFNYDTTSPEHFINEYNTGEISESIGNYLGDEIFGEAGVSRKTDSYGSEIIIEREYYMFGGKVRQECTVSVADSNYHSTWIFEEGTGLVEVLVEFGIGTQDEGFMYYIIQGITPTLSPP